MENAEKLPDFITTYFIFKGTQCKMAAIPEMLPSRSGLDFTGNYIGINIVANSGTMLFLRDQHPDLYWKCEKLPLESAPADFPHSFTFKSFTHKDEPYKVVLAHELGCWDEDEGVDFTGCVQGILISESTGTLAFTLMPDAKKGWVFEYEGQETFIDNELVDLLGKMAGEIREDVLVDKIDLNHPKHSS